MYILGIDCGGTSTKALLTTVDGRILGRGHGGPANYTVNGTQGVVESVLEAIERCLEQSVRDHPNHPTILSSVWSTLQEKDVFLALGVSGAGREAEAETIKAAFHGLGFRNVVVSHDAIIALLGALGGSDGVVVISGTGSIAYGLSGGQSARAGGWGYLLGDEGSAYWIGIRALQRVMQVYDGREGEDQDLLAAAYHYLGVQDAMEIVPLIHKIPVDRGLIGGFSREIASLAKQGHLLSQQILADAGRQLGQLSVAVLTRLGFQNVQGRVGACGGVFSAGDPILVPMQEEIHRRAPGQTLTLPEFEPVVGAVFLAARHFNLDVDRIKGGLS